MSKIINEATLKKAVEFSINRVVYNQQNKVWASTMVEKFLKNNLKIEPEGYLQAGLILGYAMRYIESKEKGFRR